VSGSFPSVIVVGAGVVGAACAEALARAGCAVEVVEASFVGSGATGAAMGHLVVMDDSEAQFALTAFSRRLWAERVAELPPEVEHRRCGTLWVAADEEEMGHVRAKAAYYAARGETAQALGPAELRDAEPGLREGLAGGLLVQDDRVLYPPAAARALLDGALHLGARLRTATVDAVAAGRARCDGEWLEADHVLVAAGARSTRLVPELPIVPRKGHLVVTDRYPGVVRHQLVELGYLKSAHTLTRESVAFNVQPRATGQLVVGSSRELVGWDDSINRPLLARMLARAIEFLPGLGTSSVLRTWTGFRPATADGRPLVGAWEPRLWVAAGHEGLGITTAPGTAQLLCSQLLGHTPPLDPAPFDPRRAMPARG
jgi:glycine/D-amino acid oxidase-like deaminating enzyme